MNKNQLPLSEIISLSMGIHQKQINIRRHLHQYPEISYNEFNTTSFLKKEIEKLGLKILPFKMETGFLAELKGSAAGPTVAIRTDIDALPITEKTTLEFKSKNIGCMHACGHDMHMAAVLGAAMVLKKLVSQINGTVRFIFQPAEEMPPGGARPMIAGGALKNVSAIFGLHVDPNLVTGKISLRDGTTMASVNDFDLIIHGKGGHAAHPETSVDALVIACEVVDAVQKIVSREINPITPVAVTFGTINGGVARNVIADRVILKGTARALSKKATRDLPRLIKRTASAVCKGRGAKLEMNIIADYPVLFNNARVTRLFSKNYQALFGKGKIEETPPTLGGEDFACYLEKVPGAMFRLGVMNKKIKADKPWHSSEFIADENALTYGTALLAAAAIDFLKNGL